jgi:hypothetical protein
MGRELPLVVGKVIQLDNGTDDRARDSCGKSAVADQLYIIITYIKLPEPLYTLQYDFYIQLYIQYF